MATKARPARTAPLDRWLWAGTPGSEPYPCMCYGSRACTKRCPCHGRTDGLDAMPALCCAKTTKESE